MANKFINIDKKSSAIANKQLNAIVDKAVNTNKN